MVKGKETVRAVFGGIVRGGVVKVRFAVLQPSDGGGPIEESFIVMVWVVLEQDKSP